jgi:hypothetical protein
LPGWLCVHSLGQIIGEDDGGTSRIWIDEWILGKVMAEALHGLGFDDGSARQAIAAVKALTAHPGVLAKDLAERLEMLLGDSAAQQFLQLNRWKNVLWFNQQAFEQLMSLMFAATVVEITAARRPAAAAEKEIETAYEAVEKLWHAEAESQFKVDALLAALRPAAAARPRRRAATKKTRGQKQFKPAPRAKRRAK